MTRRPGARPNVRIASIELWVGEVKAGGKLEQVPGVVLNGAIGDAAQWMPGSSDLLVQLVPAARGEPPVAPPAPGGPVIQESEPSPRAIARATAWHSRVLAASPPNLVGAEMPKAPVAATA